MDVERNWQNVSFAVSGDQTYLLGDPALSISPRLDEAAGNDGEVYLGIRTAFGALPILDIGTRGILTGSKVYEAGRLKVFTDNAEVVISEPGKLILVAESCDGSTSPLSFTVG